MLKATAGKIMPTTITGSLPRPSWYTENLGTRSFLDAMVLSRFREQYVDALSVYLQEQEVAGLDIVTDGDCRFDSDIGGQSWTSYPPHHMTGFDTQHPDNQARFFLQPTGRLIFLARSQVLAQLKHSHRFLPHQNHPVQPEQWLLVFRRQPEFLLAFAEPV